MRAKLMRKQKYVLDHPMFVLLQLPFWITSYRGPFAGQTLGGADGSSVSCVSETKGILGLQAKSCLRLDLEHEQ